MSSSVTSSRRKPPSDCSASTVSVTRASSFSTSGIEPKRSSDARAKSPCFCELVGLGLELVEALLLGAQLLDEIALVLPARLHAGGVLPDLGDLALDLGQALRERRSFSRASAARSTSRVMMRRSRLSIGVGTLSISILRRAAASSMRSMALSGNWRAGMYRCDSFASRDQRGIADANAVVDIVLLSLRPRRIAMVSSTLGSSIMTGWKRRSSALSFSMCLRYSSKASSRRCSADRHGRARASGEVRGVVPTLGEAPAPTSVCSSSMKRMIEPAAPEISLRTAFRRSSNSPRYFAPAIRAPRSNEQIFLSRSDSWRRRRTPCAGRCPRRRRSCRRRPRRRARGCSSCGATGSGSCAGSPRRARSPDRACPAVRGA